MTVTEMLLKADAKKVEEMKEGTFKSEMLARALGKEGTVEIKIREIPPKKLAEYMDGAVTQGDDLPLPTLFESSKKIVLAGVVDPDLKDSNLKDHFGCKMAIDLVEKLFRNEVYAISEAIQKLSETAGTTEEDIKN